MGDKVLYINNDNEVRLVNLTDLDGVAVADATVTITVQDLTGTNVTGATFPMTMTYDNTTDSDYAATLPESLVLENGAKYKGVITASTPSALNGEWTCTYIARTRTCE